jgi:hypothetical protein
MFKTFLTSDIPSYYKIYLTSYLTSYMSGYIFFIVFTVAAIIRLANSEGLDTLYKYNPASIIVLNWIIYYVLGYSCFLIALCRMHSCNRNLLFPEYRKRSKLYLVYKQLRYALMFQANFYTVMSNYFCLGGLDHLMARSRICGATNKDLLRMNTCTALAEICKFNSGSWTIAILLALLALATVWEDYGYTTDGQVLTSRIPSLEALLFAVPALYISFCSFTVPIMLNPYVWGCYRRPEKKQVGAAPKSARDMGLTVGSVDTRVYSPPTKRIPVKSSRIDIFKRASTPARKRMSVPKNVSTKKTPCRSTPERTSTAAEARKSASRSSAKRPSLGSPRRVENKAGGGIFSV